MQRILDTWSPWYWLLAVIAVLQCGTVHCSSVFVYAQRPNPRPKSPFYMLFYQLCMEQPEEDNTTATEPNNSNHGGCLLLFYVNWIKPHQDGASTAALSKSHYSADFNIILFHRVIFNSVSEVSSCTVCRYLQWSNPIIPLPSSLPKPVATLLLLALVFTHRAVGIFIAFLRLHHSIRTWM